MVISIQFLDLWESLGQESAHAFVIANHHMVVSENGDTPKSSFLKPFL